MQYPRKYPPDALIRRLRVIAGHRERRLSNALANLGGQGFEILEGAECVLHGAQRKLMLCGQLPKPAGQELVEKE